MAQRRQLSYRMVEDILTTLNSSAVIEGATVISCDRSILALAANNQVEALDTGGDHGYAEDTLKGIQHIGDVGIDKIMIIPADVPALSNEDLTQLNKTHNGGITLCPAANDGGTNALVFTPPLSIRLMYGESSLTAFQQEAERHNVPTRIQHCAGLACDIDRLEDLISLTEKTEGGLAWRYARSLRLSR